MNIYCVMHPCFCVFIHTHTKCIRYRINFILMGVFCFRWSTLCLVRNIHNIYIFRGVFSHYLYTLRAHSTNHTLTLTLAFQSLFLYRFSSIRLNLFTAEFVCLFHRHSTISMIWYYCNAAADTFTILYTYTHTINGW